MGRIELPQELIDNVKQAEKILIEVSKDIQIAKAAKIPSAAVLEERANECMECIASLKEHYFPKPRRK